MNKQHPPTMPIARFKTCLSLGLAVLLAVPLGFAQDADSVRRIQEENAALRKRLAELESRAAAAPARATTTAPATGAAAAPAMGAPEDNVTVMSPFEVKTEKDYGYLKTNAVTATRIGTEIQHVPLAISVMTSEFIQDANIQSLTDIFRYSSSGYGDNAFRMARPANSATPQGGMTMRGFPMNTFLRNGVFRYTSYNLDNTDRVEIVKGPAAVFFGQGYPGGVINYITKQPVFGKQPTTITHTTGSDHKDKVVFDMNQQFSKKAAMRVIGSWENSGGEKRWEYMKNNNATVGLTLIPFDSGKLRITTEVEILEQRYNFSNDYWRYPEEWFQAWNSPSASLIAAAGLTANANPVAAYQTRIGGVGGQGNWIVDVRNATQDYTLPLWTKVTRGARYIDKSGKRIMDEAFNFKARGAFSDMKVNTVDTTVDFSPTDWLDFRYVLTHDNNRFNNIEGQLQPYGDGRRFNSQVSVNSSGYYRKADDHQFDLIFKKDMFNIKHKVLVGGITRKVFQNFNGPPPNGGGVIQSIPYSVGPTVAPFNNPTPNGSFANYQYPASTGVINIATNNWATALFPFYGQIPGASNPAGNPNWALAPQSMVNTNQVRPDQVIRDRFNNIKTVQQVYTEFDPGAEIAPDISKIVLFDKPTLDGYATQDQSGYANYQASLLNNRLNIIAGVRREMHRDSGQYLVANFPWFAPGPYAWADPATYPPSVYGYDFGYANDIAGNFSRLAGTSWMGGVSFDIRKDLTVYASSSKVFKINSGSNQGGYVIPDIPLMVADALAFGNGSFNYRGATIRNVADFQTKLHEIGADALFKHETGQNVEVGVKTSLWDSKLVGTVSFFHAYRQNQRLDDGAAQAAEPFNAALNAAYFAPTSRFFGVRNFRWRTIGIKNVIEGGEAEFIWTPRRNFQSIINGSWLWTAKTTDNPTVNKPGSTAYNAQSTTTAAGIQSRATSDIYYGSRIENTPEFRFNTFSKYTFTEGMFRGLQAGVGTRYSSKAIISRSIDWNPMRNGFQAGNYLVFDTTVSFPWEVQGFRVNSSVNVQNLADKLYFEGGPVPSPGRQLFIINSLKF